VWICGVRGTHGFVASTISLSNIMTRISKGDARDR
jgi:hypothetical protein